MAGLIFLFFGSLLLLAVDRSESRALAYLIGLFTGMLMVGMAG